MEELISRQAVNEYLEKLLDGRSDDFMSAAIIGIKDNINAMPLVTPTHGTCKDCRYSSVHTISLDKIDEMRVCRIQFSKQIKDDYYCANYEKRSSEDERQETNNA